MLNFHTCTVILIRIIFKQTAEVNQVGPIPDNLSSHGIIYVVAYLVHNRQKMQPSKFRIKFHISTTNLAACVCVSSKFDQFLPVRFYFVSKRPENFVRIAKFPYAAFGPLFAFHCPLFVTKNNNLGWNRHASPHTGTCRCNDHGPTVLSARGQ